jgi:hypothetical protein
MNKMWLMWGAALAIAAGSVAAADEEPPPQPPMAAPGALPELDADEYFQGRTPGTFGKDIVKILPATPRVAVAGFRVVYIIEDTATASVRATYLPGGVETTAAHSKMTVKLDGVDYATMQALTDKAYASFLQQLKAAGREVIAPDKVQPMLAGLEAAETKPEAPYTKGSNRGLGVAFSPSGIPLWWMNGDLYGNVGPFNQHNMRAIPDISKELDAFVIAPEIVVQFAKMESSGNRSGFLAKEAKVGASLAVAVRTLHTQITHATETKGGLLSGGDQGDINMKKGVAVEQPFAELAEEESAKTSKFMSFMTGAARSHSTQVAQTDNERYGAVAQVALNQATGALAKFFAQHPAQAQEPAPTN